MQWWGSGGEVGKCLQSGSKVGGWLGWSSGSLRRERSEKIMEGP